MDVTSLINKLSHDEPPGTALWFLQKIGRPIIYLASGMWILSYVYLNMRAASGAVIDWPPSHVSSALVAIVVVGILGRQWGKNHELSTKCRNLRQKKGPETESQGLG